MHRNGNVLSNTQKNRLSAVLVTAIGVAALLAQSSTYLVASDALIPITKTEVLGVFSAHLRARGVAEEQFPHLNEIELPASIPAAPDRALRLVSACWNAKVGRAQLRLECSDTGQCVPFLAYVRSTTSPFEAAIGACPGASPSRTLRHPPRKPVLLAGDRATVVYSSGHMRLTAVVTCLERGAEGDVIRVRNQDGRTFRARIASPALLEAITP